eukprot:TRINITY_DN2921_c0_g1_i1.p1 TRINITY_DN2921_c0_g1~~TRINITY_DN2921_c0_g1_i1.p1  ORF type:complete len:169 (-),score=50.54 TRINITY_DN2921_c0_g1_i1:66-572(-)
MSSSTPTEAGAADAAAAPPVAIPTTPSGDGGGAGAGDGGGGGDGGKKAKYVKRAVTFDEFETRYVFQEDRTLLSVRRLENAHWYPTNQSNTKYVESHVLKYMAFRATAPRAMPSHPRERHRCDYHLSDFFSSLYDRKASIYGTGLQMLKCIGSSPGEEPERLREEYWF